jgi:ADP-ribose pyrophosphatase YjhB (NUDIX family)
MATRGTALSENFEQRIPEGDDRPRRVCADCGFVDYENPKVVVGSVVAWQDRVLLCRRAIDPRKGFWTLPAGYLELHESAADGARREAWEEARANIEINQLLSQVQLIYRARLAAPEVAPGPETAELDLFAWDRIPWDDLAFPSVHWALGHFREVEDLESFAPRVNPPDQTGDLTDREQGL